MKFSRFVALLLLLTAAGIVAGSLIVTATPEIKLALQDPLDQKLAPWVIAKTAGGADAEFLVILKDQADLGGAALLQTREEKGRFVFDALRAKAAASQAPLVEFLRQRNAEYRTFYIINAVLVKGSRALANEIAARADVARVAGNPTLPGVMPIEPEASDLSNLATATPDAVEPGIAYIHAPEVWAMGFTGQGLVIGGQDTGVQWDHPALRKQYRGWDGAGASHDYNWHDGIHNNGGACGPDSKTPCDDFDHGTHTLGSAIGTDGGANQIGVAPGAKFIACRNMDRGNGTPASYLECFEFFLAPYPVGATPAQGNPAKAPDITVNSWGCPPSEGCEPDTLKLAVEAQRAAGIMTVVSAGNDGFKGCGSVSDPPALYDAAYSVGAFDPVTGGIASFSSRGPVTADASNRVKPDIAAPGVGVRSAVRGGNYVRLNGTSMASPHVAGASALLWSAHPWLRGQIELTENLLNESAVRVEANSCGNSTLNGGFPNNTFGFGRLDILAAVELASTIVNPSAAALAATSVTPSDLQLGVRGGTGRIEVATSPAVIWRALSRDPWIMLVALSNFTGSGGVNFIVSENTGTQPRRGTVMIAGHVVTITQPGDNPPYAASGRVVNGTGEGLGKVTLTFTRLSGNGEIPAPVQTDDNGAWRQSGFEPGTTYRVTPSSRRQTFSPATRDFSAAGTTLDFTSVGRGVIINR
ncbi:MAG: S8 family serine peptidase [Blastocatellia bacterium]